MLPLEGITVVALEQAVAAPFCSRQLADLGARVIKIERPGGRRLRARLRPDGQRPVGLFRLAQPLQGKPDAGCQTSRGAEILARLIAGADVFIQNLAPGAAKRLGLGADELLAQHPRLIVCDISGYGIAGPYAHKKAYDLLVQSEAGRAVADRHAGVAGQGRHFHHRHRHRAACLCRDSRRALTSASARARARAST